MRFKFITIFFLLVSFSQLFLEAEGIPSYQNYGKRRFALVMGNNFGGKSNKPLKYAIRDVISFSSLLNEIGGVKEDDKIVLINPSIKSLKAGFIQLTSMLEEASSQGIQFETIIYYSGHSNHEGLQLYNDIYSYTALEKVINDLPSKVKIVILDSCASGAFTRIKGAEIYPPFLTDTSNVATGHAYLTSCRDTEVAHESDKIKASVFTYAMLTGLRGAADDNNDGNITLNELYQYAFNNTISYTQKEAPFPQHPAYQLNLTGTGNIILTNIRTNTARLLLGEELTGNCFIKDEKNNLLIETFKCKGKQLELCLPPGQYDIFLYNDKETYKKQYKFEKATTNKIYSFNEMKKINQESLPQKGEKHEKSFFSTEISAGVNIPESHISDWLNMGIMPLWGLRYNWQYNSNIISLGLINGIAFQQSSDKLTTPYSLFTIPLSLSARYAMKLFFLYPYIELNGGISINVQQYKSGGQALALKPIVDAAIGLYFPLDRSVNMGFYFRAFAIPLSDYFNIGFTPGIQMNIFLE